VLPLLGKFKGLSSKIYVAFLVTAVVPVCIAGLVGIFYSLNALKNETLQHLEQEVAGRSDATGRFFDQLSSELLYLASSSSLRELAGTAGAHNLPSPRQARLRLKRDFAAFAKAYPHIYQVRYLDAYGREIVRVDRHEQGRIYVVPDDELQDKSDRYYVHETLALDAGEIYVSPLDLNVERGQVEVPERPVVRFGTPIADSAGLNRGLLIVNLHAELILGQIQQMAGARGGIAYLFNRSGFYLARSGDDPAGAQSFEMKSLESLAATYPRDLLARILSGARGTDVLGEWIVAYAPVAVRSTATKRDAPMEWAIVLAFPRNRLFAAVFNLYILYGVLAVSLLATALAGFLLSRHLLRPLELLRAETEEIAQGHFSSRVEIKGHDEIADLGAQFNLMASRLEHSYQSLEHQKQHLEEEVRARTAALERERSSLSTIIENTADGILALSADGVIELANVAAAQLLAAHGESLVGRHIRDYRPAWDGLQGGESGTLQQGGRFDLQVRDRTLALNVAPVARGGAHGGYIVVMRDVSEERRVQEQRRELDRQIFQTEKMTTMGELAMGLAHEIGNPLAGMKTVVQALLDEQGLNDHVRRYLTRIEGEVDRLSAFLHTFHGFAAPQEMHPAACRLEDVLDDVLLWTRKEAKSKGIHIAYRQCDHSIPALWADPNQLKQVLLNLVINAIHAMDRGGEITIGMCGPAVQDARDGLPRLRFCVEDTGSGIAPEVLPRIFDPFFTTRENGSGLGLAVVRKIAVQHGAEIAVDSRPGRGTRFQFIWPVAPVAEGDKGAIRMHDAPACERMSGHG
jgi:PAS domain S-box-containing protein